MTNSAKLLIQRAIEILTPPGAWAQGAYARDKDGIKVEEESPLACSWCVAGALRKAARESFAPFQNHKILDACDAITAEVGITIVSWNDDVAKDQSEVLSVLKTAEAKL